ncbi:uncharacterized protein BJX67DRAFT_264366 [Aspergillus lucknowensis]|uniref:F-box domain-containing protein n=1 Tax=Aspergillus lucknowensis TaxID=176173 RepID=A0ABR4LFA3_9EURO
MTTPPLGPFDRLPADLILEILGLLDDLSSVTRFLTASRRVRAARMDWPSPTIVRDLFMLNPILREGKFQTICRDVSLLHHLSLQCADYDDYRRRQADSERDTLRSRTDSAPRLPLPSKMRRNFVATVNASDAGSIQAAVHAQKADGVVPWWASSSLGASLLLRSEHLGERIGMSLNRLKGLYNPKEALMIRRVLLSYKSGTNTQL